MFQRPRLAVSCTIYNIVPELERSVSQRAVSLIHIYNLSLFQELRKPP